MSYKTCLAKRERDHYNMGQGQIVFKGQSDNEISADSSFIFNDVFVCNYNEKRYTHAKTDCQRQRI